MTTHRKRSAVLQNGANDKTVTGTRTPTQITVAPETALAARNGRAASAASRGVGAWPTRRNERASRGMPDVREQSRRLSVSLFMREQSPVRSVGFTSAIAGEGKSLLALTTAAVLAEDSIEPVLLLEANWEHPTLHEHFGLPPTPGLAEWLRGECSEEDVRHEVAENLSVVVAGDGRADAVKLLRRLRERSAAYKVTSSPALLICDLPPVVTCGYGTLAASTMESVVMVVRAGVTPEDMVAQACSQLEHLPIEGVVLNQMSSRIPLWLQRIL